MAHESAVRGTRGLGAVLTVETTSTRQVHYDADDQRVDLSVVPKDSAEVAVVGDPPCGFVFSERFPSWSVTIGALPHFVTNALLLYRDGALVCAGTALSRCRGAL
jgi:hypothetical protein